MDTIDRRSTTHGVHAERTPSFLLAQPEKRALQAIAKRLPRWILPDDLTLLGIVAALAIAAAYALSDHSSVWLWAASGLLVVHWLGDSLDGTLARVRDIQRPRYGFYLDHLVDAGATVAIAVGLGLSPYMLLSVGMLLGVAYLILSINVYLESQALGRFSIGYGKLGPTELRVLLIAINTALALGLNTRFDVLDTGLTALDVVGVALALGMLLALAARAWRSLREIAREEPAAPRVWTTSRPAAGSPAGGS
jgi:archaetidylinositol phosphate synthase